MTSLSVSRLCSMATCPSISCNSCELVRRAHADSTFSHRIPDFGEAAGRCGIFLGEGWGLEGFTVRFSLSAHGIDSRGLSVMVDLTRDSIDMLLGRGPDGSSSKPMTSLLVTWLGWLVPARVKVEKFVWDVIRGLGIF